MTNFTVVPGSLRWTVPNDLERHKEVRLANKQFTTLLASTS